MQQPSLSNISPPHLSPPSNVSLLASHKLLLLFCISFSLLCYAYDAYKQRTTNNCVRTLQEHSAGYNDKKKAAYIKLNSGNICGK